jgi:hypothetical protein
MDGDADTVTLRTERRCNNSERKHEATIGGHLAEHPCHLRFTPSQLETEVLERFSRTPVERGSLAIVATALSQVALRNPRRSPMGAG